MNNNKNRESNIKRANDWKTSLCDVCRESPLENNKNKGRKGAETDPTAHIDPSTLGALGSLGGKGGTIKETNTDYLTRHWAEARRIYLFMYLYYYDY